MNSSSQKVYSTVCFFLFLLLSGVGGYFLYQKKLIKPASQPPSSQKNSSSSEPLSESTTEDETDFSTPLAPFLNSFVLNGAIDEVGERPATFELKGGSSDAPSGKIWVSQVEKGVLLAGRIYALNPQWPANIKDMIYKDHVEVWFSLSPDLELPPIGWGNQFGYCELSKAQDCDTAHRSQNPDTEHLEDDGCGGGIGGKEECRAWYQAQTVYRRSFEKLFQRQWLIAPHQTIEAYATPAWNQLKKFDPKNEEKLSALLSPLKPREGVESEFIEDPSKGSGYSFEILIPWDAMPPAMDMPLESMNVRVDVFGSGKEGKQGLSSSTFPERKYGDLDSLDEVELGKPRAYFLTPCHYDFEGQNTYGESVDAYFHPTQDLDIRSTFVIQNDVAGYRYEAEGLSPIIQTKNYYVRDLKSGEFVCGPQLTYMKNGQTFKPECDLDKEEGEAVCGDHLEKDFEVKTLPGDIQLIKNGPWVTTFSPFGAGMCGACPYFGIEMYTINSQGKIETAFTYNQVVGEREVDDADLWVSKDWKQITIFKEVVSKDQKSSSWVSTTYCWKDDVLKYVSCDEKKNIPEPKPRNLLDQFGLDR